MGVDLGDGLCQSACSYKGAKVSGISNNRNPHGNLYDRAIKRNKNAAIHRIDSES